MSTRFPGPLALLTVWITLAGCTPTPPTAPTPAPASSPPFATTWTGDPDQKSPTWAAGLDPESRYGLHRRVGLDPVLKPETRVLSAAEVATISKIEITNSEACLDAADAHPMCQFALTFTSVPSWLSIGSVLNAGITATTPNGLLVRVTAIDANRVSATQATLPEALVQGEFWVEQAFSPDQLRGEPVLADGVKVVPRRTKGMRKSFPGVLPRFDELSLPGELSIDTEPVSGVHVSGSLDFGAGCGLDGGVGGSDIAWMEISCQAWESTSLSVVSTKDGPVSTERYPIGYFPLAAFPIPIGPLVVVVIVDIVLTVDLSGQVHVGMSYAGHQSAKVRGALRFSLGSGLDHDGGVETSAGASGGGLKKDLSITVLGRAEVRLSAYGVLGISVGGDTSLTLAGGPKQNPRWRVLGNAGIFVKLFLGIIGYELNAYIRYHLKQPFPIASGGNVRPTLSVSWPTDGAQVRVGGLLPPKLEATASDPEDGVLPVRWEDQTDHVTVEGVGPQMLPFTALGPHTIRVSAVDSEGAAVEKVLTITVLPPTLTVSLRWIRLDGGHFSGRPSGHAGGTLLVQATVTSSQLSGPSCAELTWAATNATLAGDGTCRATVTLGQPGAAVVTVALTDTFGTAAEAQAPITVSTAPATVTPQFLGIDATANGTHLTSGDQLLGATPVTLMVSYLNADQAAVTPTYAWTVTTGGTSADLPGGRERLASSRTYTPPNPWGHQARFTVVIRNASTKAVLTTRTFDLGWQSLPK